jgi:hypothetical protein
MTKLAYIDRKFQGDSLEIIARAEGICQDYANQGYDLTLRQLYYQFVARGWLANSQQSYKRLGSVINDARLAGMIDWDHLVDRTRNLASLAAWNSPADILSAVAAQYRENKWAGQAERVEVWVEKEALAGVIARPADRWQVPYFSCRGYVSQSEMHSAGLRIRRHERSGRKVTVIHLGDHDPSGLDMTRDIRDRLELFGCSATVKRIALNMDQVEAYDPPPNPAKITDSRAEDYISEYGPESWELDALDPATLDALVEGEILAHLNRAQWDAALEQENDRKFVLGRLSARWDEVQEYTRSLDGADEDDDDDEEEV